MFRDLEVKLHILKTGIPFYLFRGQITDFEVIFFLLLVKFIFSTTFLDRCEKLDKILKKIEIYGSYPSLKTGKLQCSNKWSG